MDLHSGQDRQAHKSSSGSNKIDLRNEIQKTYRSRPASWSRWLFDHLDLPEGASILELGCGSGSLWQENRERIPSGWKVILSDRLPRMANASRGNLAGAMPHAGFACLDGQRIPFPDESFDMVLAVGVLDLVPDLEVALTEVWRVLRPSGLLVASAGGQAHLLEMRKMLRPYLPSHHVEHLGGETGRFGLENGQDRLSGQFEEVVRHDYIDRMQFTRLQPILEYVLSEDAVVWDMRLDHLSHFVRDVQKRISEHGQVSVQIQKGIFIARKKIVRMHQGQAGAPASHSSRRSSSRFR